MSAIGIFFPLSVLIAISHGQAGQTGLYPDQYNLIDADPSCRHSIPDNTCCVSARTPQCPSIYSGAGDVDVMAIHPNINERTDYLMRNMARLFPDFYADSQWGWGGTYAGDCDKPTHKPTKPFYFMSEAVQAARWNSFSGATQYSGCTRGQNCTLVQDAQTGHYTCCNYCEHNSWGLCGYNYRTKAMVQLLFSSNAFNDVGSEGIWGGNTALMSSSAHCGMVFNYEYHHQGIGYYPSGSTTMVGIKDTADWEDYVFVHASHFDWDQNDFTFLVQFFGGKKIPAIIATEVYLLYKGQMIGMENVVSEESNGTSGFFMNSQTYTAECEPYAFIAKDTTANWWRLPEDEKLYFGTVDSASALREESADCAENHYFHTESEWVANGGDGLTNIKNTGNGCVGCDKIAVLEDLYLNRDATTANPVPSPTAPPVDEATTAEIIGSTVSTVSYDGPGNAVESYGLFMVIASIFTVNMWMQYV